MALSNTSHQILWMQSLLEEIGYLMKAISLNGDNQDAIFMTSNPVQEKCIKHMDICYHFIRQVVKNEKVVLYYIEGDKNPTDMFTKNLGHLKFLHFRGQLRLKFYSPKDA